MCIIVYKPTDVAFPSKNTLKVCFENNPDGSGFMYADNGRVVIRKGFMTFKKFWKELNNVRNKVGDDKAYVMHFRIGTQGANSKELTHPYPLSGNMDDLKKTKFVTNIGIAHNGIISLTSDKAEDYNDTMKFITDYMSLLITSIKFYKHQNIIDIINKLSGSKFAILDYTGHCEMTGKGWVTENGVYYSNTSFIEVSYKLADLGAYGTYKYYGGYSSDYPSCFGDEYIKIIDLAYDENLGLYKFDQLNCPAMMGDDSLCDVCVWYRECYGCYPDWLEWDKEYIKEIEEAKK